MDNSEIKGTKNNKDTDSDSNNDGRLNIPELIPEEFNRESCEDIFLQLRLKIMIVICDLVLHQFIMTISILGDIEELFETSGEIDTDSQYGKALNEANLLASLSVEIIKHLKANIDRFGEKDDRFDETFLKRTKYLRKEQIEEMAKNLTKNETDHCIVYRADPSKFSKRVLNIVGYENMDSIGPNLLKIKEAADSFCNDLNVLSDRYFAEKISEMSQFKKNSETNTSTAKGVSLKFSRIDKEIERLNVIYEIGFKRWYSDAYQNLAIYLEIIYSCVSISEKAFLISQNLGGVMNYSFLLH